MAIIIRKIPWSLILKWILFLLIYGLFSSVLGLDLGKTFDA